MNDTEIIIEVAKLDGWYESEEGKTIHPLGGTIWINDSVPDREYDCAPNKIPHVWNAYLTSRDAIIPVIEKLSNYDFWSLTENLTDYRLPSQEQRKIYICATPRQLCIALIKATGKWRDQ